MRVRERFRELMERGDAALIPFVMAGDPSIDATVRIAEVLGRSGADMIELGLCFSDPIADGPTIQAASERALEAGVTPDVYFRIAREVSDAVSVPLIALTYYNMVIRKGISRFLQSCVKSGISGVIVPDLPVDEADDFRSAAGRCSIDTIFLAAPTSDRSRLKKIVNASTGFVYLVSVLGVTGARRTVSREAGGLIKMVKSIESEVPVAVGFGVSSPRHVLELTRMGADGVIVGSALIDIISKHMKNEDVMLAEVGRYIRAMSGAAKT
jgi:tryptophan synthase alpha chain